MKIVRGDKGKKAELIQSVRRLKQAVDTGELSQDTPVLPLLPQPTMAEQDITPRPNPRQTTRYLAKRALREISRLREETIKDLAEAQAELGRLRVRVTRLEPLGRQLMNTGVLGARKACRILEISREELVELGEIARRDPLRVLPRVPRSERE